MGRRADAQWCAVSSARAGTAWKGRPARRAAVLRAAFAAAVLRASSCAAVLRAVLRGSLRVVREVVGAPDYERYLEHHARCHPGVAPLDRRGFYAEFVTRRFGPGPTRCC